MNHYFEQIGALPRKENIRTMYIVGFILSLFCTIAAYMAVTQMQLPRLVLIAVIVFLALGQCVVQGICFLHVNGEKGTRMKRTILFSAIGVVAILVGGSLWIMINLNARMMPGDAQMEQYMQNEDGF
ncbi:MAG TPA: cytochrome C oxidase subunit IV family protein [Candidatus Paceibacterota bacterium]|nr:cytochrome C oxidase subunit IV family protein [Candidatus Paceibacterota bacterium]